MCTCPPLWFDGRAGVEPPHQALAREVGSLLDVNRKGIERTHKAMGGEGTLVLALQTKQAPNVATLDAAIPLDDGEGPANGGWFPGQRSWLLLIEGLDEVIYPWIDDLARSLESVGIEGTLTGAGSVGTPAWTHGMDYHPFHLDAAYQAGPDARLWNSPSAHEQLTQNLAGHTVDWLSAEGARIRVGIRFSANFWMDARATARMMRQELASDQSFSAEGYHQAHREVRHAHATEPGRLSLQTNGTPWERAVADLRATLIGLPLDRLSVASISTHGSFIRDLPSRYADDDPDTFAYTTHPKTWGEFVAEPHGIQILTNNHLELAGDLASWSTTRLDAKHVLVEARDLAAWYGGPRTYAPVRSGSPAWTKAREDFGEMVLTWGRAAELGIASRPNPSLSTTG